MPTLPIKELLPEIDPGVKSNLNQFGALIDEAINFGTHVLTWHMQTAKGADEIAPVTFSFRHILELLGATSTCVKSSYVDLCRVLLRALLESLLGLAYILREDSVRRGFAFLAVEAYQRLKQMRALDKSTPARKTLEQKLAKDTVAPGFTAEIPQEMVKESIARTEAFLQTPGPKAALSEFRRIKSKNKNSNPNWYSLYDGPQNLEQLADALGYQSMYQFFYKYWSKSTHGVDVIQGNLVRSISGRAAVVQLRLPKEAQSITQISITFALHTIRLMIDAYCPEKRQDYAKWYIAEMRDPFLQLCNEEFIKIRMPGDAVPG